jgi:murein DD-endopeptidase MepM/ murein hydrolase activator NlpD
VEASADIAIERRVFPEQRLDVEEKFVTPPPEVEQRIARETERLSAVYAARRAAAPPGRAFVRPVSGQPTGVFGTRRIFNGKPRSPHPGLDLKAASGLVRCSGPGVVALADDLYFSGNTVIVDHGGDSSRSTPTCRGSTSKRAGRSPGAVGRPLPPPGDGPSSAWGAKIGDRPFDPTALLSAKIFPSGPP